MSISDAKRSSLPNAQRLQRTFHCIGALSAILLVGGCNAQPPAPTQDPSVGVSITGVDHLADHLSVQEFSVNGFGGGRAGRGSGKVCCAMLPAEWRDSLRVNVEWVEQNWRDCSYRRRQRDVPVEHYEEAGRLRVHFLADGAVRVIVANVGPRNPDYPGPRDEPPSKAPWSDYPNDAHCNRQWTEDTTP